MAFVKFCYLNMKLYIMSWTVMRSDCDAVHLLPSRLSPVMIYDPSACISPPSEDMELEALIKHLLGELRHRETVILENIESLKVKSKI